MRRLLRCLLLPIVLSTATCATAPAAPPVTSMPSAAPTPVPPPAADPAARADKLDHLSRAFVAELAAGSFAEASHRFGPKMTAALTPAKLGEIWAALGAQAGAFGGVESGRLVKTPGVWVSLLTCRFAHAPLVLEIAFDDEDRVEGFHVKPGDTAAAWAPPAYADPASFTERAVTVGTTPELPGTLTLPKGKGPFPVVVLVHGSGPNDADETLGPNKVFKDLAWGIATRGVAVLRYEKRSHHPGAGAIRTVKEEALDAAHAGVELLRHTPEVDARRIVIVGHSQGGYLAPRLAHDDPTLAGLVLLAGSDRPVEDSLLEQVTYFAGLDPTNAALAKKVAAVTEEVHRLRDPALKPDDTVTLGGTSLPGAYFLDVRDYRPSTVAKGLTVPMLILQGERDYQVTPATDFASWKAALGGRAGVTFTLYPGLNHLFMEGSGTPSPAEYMRPGQHVDAKVVADVAAWVGRLAGR
jgi:dienelactone hydrolase